MSTNFSEIQVPVVMTNESASNTPQGALTTTITNGVISAQRVDVKRDIAAIMNNIKASASVMGEKYYYHWETKNRDGSRGKVEGGTVKLALDIARLYGNCQVDCRAEDTGTHIEFHARFVDVESGFSLTRPFRQRKDQNTGMKDKGRAEDIVLQIGASKAIRNVILNSLPTLAEFAMQEAKKGLLARVAKNPEGARNSILETIKEIGVPLVRVEKIIGRQSKNWTNQDLAKLYVQVESIRDNHATIDDIFPTSEPEKVQIRGNEGAKEALANKKTAPESLPESLPESELDAIPDVAELIMQDGVIKKFPSEIDTVGLMTELQSMVPAYEQDFIRQNHDALLEIIKFMRADGKPNAADNIEKLLK